MWLIMQGSSRKDILVFKSKEPVKIFSAAQIKEWDAFTIKQEGIASAQLMERAADACYNWIIEKFTAESPFKIFCSTGNNGGDGLFIAGKLLQRNYRIQVFVVAGKTSTDDFQTGLAKLKELHAEIFFIESDRSFPAIEKNDIVIDALFGTGLNKKPSGICEKLIDHLNEQAAVTIAIDVPSGLYIDKSSAGNAVIKASHTLTFQQYKLAFLLAENEAYCGQVVVLPIGLSEKFYAEQDTNYQLTDKEIIKGIYVKRKAFANKGDYGYACIIAGSYGMMGAAVMSSQACLRSGVGKLTTYVCKQGYEVMQACVPEAMCKVFGNTFIKDVEGLTDFTTIGIGPGIGKHPSHRQLLQKVFKEFKKPLVIDADALNILSKNKSLYQLIPPQSIITPHPKEFERLFGKSENDFERIDMALQKAKELDIIIVLKGHHTFIATPEGNGYFNSTGNAGMATAGAGDVLTGTITGLLAQHYTPLHAAILGVYLHGLAGDKAAEKLSKEAMIAGDIITYLGEAFLEIAYA